MGNIKNTVIIILGLVVLCSVAALVVLATLFSLEKKANEPTVIVTPAAPVLTTAAPVKKICTSKACINAANNILKNMDTSVDPCENFNKFSCGGFIKNERIDEDKTQLSTFNNLRKDLDFAVSDALMSPLGSADTVATNNTKKYFLSCMNEEFFETNGEAEFRNVFANDLSEWPLITPAYDPKKTSAIDSLIKYNRADYQPIFEAYVESDPKDPTSNVIKVKQASWYFAHDYYTHNTEVIAAHKELIKQVVMYLNPTSTDPTNEIELMYELEKKFALARLTVAEKRNATYATHKIADLETLFPGFEWTKFITAFFADQSFTVNDQQTVLVYDWKYLVEATKIYADAIQNDVKKRSLDNLMAWTFASNNMGGLPKKYKDAFQAFNKVYRGSNSIQSRVLTCTQKIAVDLPYTTGRLYVKDNFDENAKKLASEMIENIRQEFKLIVQNLSWMDAASKKAALEKADAIQKMIGYPDWIMNNTHLDLKHKDYIFDETKYQQNVMIVHKNDVKNNAKSLKEKNDMKRWISGPAIVNAFYEETLNSITFPAGILKQPFFDEECPQYLNYGGIGFVMGHEITHGFDDQGRSYDKEGVFIPDGQVGLWTDYTIEQFKIKAKCIVDQYTGFFAEQVGIYVKGEQTQGESIADNGGFGQSYKAYQKWVEKNGEEPLLPGIEYNQNQLYFINFAQVWCTKWRDAALTNQIITGVHPPGEFRIIGSTQNYAGFAEAFKCKAGTTNNPTKKCVIW